MICECKKYYVNFEYKKKNFCSECYSKITGKTFGKYSYDSEDIILNTLKNIYYPNSIKIKLSEGAHKLLLLL